MYRHTVVKYIPPHRLRHRHRCSGSSSHGSESQSQRRQPRRARGRWTQLFDHDVDGVYAFDGVIAGVVFWGLD